MMIIVKGILLRLNLVNVEKLARNMLNTDIKFANPEQILWSSNIDKCDD